MSYQNNVSPFGNPNMIPVQNNQRLEAGSGFKLYKNFNMLPDSSEGLCQKRMYQAYIVDEDVEENLVKKVKTTSNSTANICYQNNNQIYTQAKSDISAPKIPAKNIDISVKNRHSVGSDLDAGSSDVPSDSTSDTQEDRTNYEAVFKQMHDNLVVGFQRQLEFIQVMRKMNSPEYAMLWPSLDKINPMVAGMMKEKAKMDIKTVMVMKNAHRMIKNDIQKGDKKPSEKFNDDEMKNIVDQLMKFIHNGKI